MKTGKFVERLNPLIQGGADLIMTLDTLAADGQGERTRDTLEAAVMALEAANRLMVLAYEEAQVKEFTP